MFENAVKDWALVSIPNREKIVNASVMSDKSCGRVSASFCSLASSAFALSWVPKNVVRTVLYLSYARYCQTIP